MTASVSPLIPAQAGIQITDTVGTRVASGLSVLDISSRVWTPACAGVSGDS